jgi:hypothetical protein
LYKTKPIFNVKMYKQNPMFNADVYIYSPILSREYGVVYGQMGGVNMGVHLYIIRCDDKYGVSVYKFVREILNMGYFVLYSN